MRITEIKERAVPISRHGPHIKSANELDTSMVAVVTDAVIDGAPVVGYGFGSIGRFAQSGLIRERFGKRLLDAKPEKLVTRDGDNIDPFKAWSVMMAGEKVGGHGERCVAVGALDMALWDAASKIARKPLYQHLADIIGRDLGAEPDIAVYAGGGYYYREGDTMFLVEEIERMLALGYRRVKIKIGATPLPRDLKRIEAVLGVLPDAGHLAVDAMNQYAPHVCLDVARELAGLGLWWFEEFCDPHDFETQAAVAEIYPGAIAMGETLFSEPEAKLLHRYGGLRPDKDVLLFDPAHCYGIPGYLKIVAALEENGWPRAAFWPHGGHLYTLHVVRALGLGGAEVNPLCFLPFGGLTDAMTVENGRAALSDGPGIGFEAKADLAALFETL